MVYIYMIHNDTKIHIRALFDTPIDTPFDTLLFLDTI